MTEADRQELAEMRASLDEQQSAFREKALHVLSYASFREVSDLTGISTNTLQRWKKETGQ